MLFNLGAKVIKRERGENANSVRVEKHWVLLLETS